MDAFACHYANGGAVFVVELFCAARQCHAALRGNGLRCPPERVGGGSLAALSCWGDSTVPPAPCLRGGFRAHVLKLSGIIPSQVEPQKGLPEPRGSAPVWASRVAYPP